MRVAFVYTPDPNYLEPFVRELVERYHRDVEIAARVTAEHENQMDHLGAQVDIDGRRQEEDRDLPPAQRIGHVKARIQEQMQKERRSPDRGHEGDGRGEAALEPKAPEGPVRLEEHRPDGLARSPQPAPGAQQAGAVCHVVLPRGPGG